MSARIYPKKIKVICTICGKKTIRTSAWAVRGKTKTCNAHCRQILSYRNIKNKDERNRKLSLARIGIKNPSWKGNNVGYIALHNWIRRRLKKPKKCQICKKRPTIDLANISQKYKRDLADWEWLCRKCHMVKDGRLRALIKGNTLKTLPDINCQQCSKIFKPRQRRNKYCSKSCSTTYFNLNERIYEKFCKKPTDTVTYARWCIDKRK